MEHGIIRFNEMNYPARSVTLPEFGKVVLSTTMLNSALLNENYSYTSKEAQQIDEGIFYFVEEEQLGLEENELIALLISEIV